MKICFINTFAVVSLVLYSCTAVELPNKDNRSLERLTVFTKSDVTVFSNAVYDLSTSSWLLEKGDPYELDHFNASLLQVSNGKHEVLSATHYILTVYPRNQEEQSELELNDELNISYYPFIYCLASPSESEWLDRNAGKDMRCLPANVKYIEHYTTVDVNGNLTEHTQALPVLYVAWPVSRSLPDYLDYDIDYMAFIPSQDEDRNIIRQAEHLAISHTGWGKESANRYSVKGVGGYIYHYDTMLDSTVSMVNLKLKFQEGSNIVTAFTNLSGHFYAPVPVGASVYCVYESSRWKITESNSTVPIQVYLGIVDDGFNTDEEFVLTNFESAIHIPISYYFSEQHPINVPDSGTVLQIKLTRTIENWGASFTAPMIGSPYIEISSNSYVNTGSLFATVCHELGHFTHYYHKNNWINYFLTHLLIRESYASYVSWTISHFFYLSACSGGAPDTSWWDYYFCQNRQGWKKTATGDTSYYSPLFVDLADDDNQWLYDSLYNYDTVSGVSESVIRDIAVSSGNWTQVKNKLYYYVGTAITMSDYNQIIQPYDYYFSHN